MIHELCRGIRMSSAFQPLAIPYRIIDGSPFSCVFHRADFNQWQFIAGGDSAFDAAKRETLEESEVQSNKWIELKAYLIFLLQ